MVSRTTEGDGRARAEQSCAQPQRKAGKYRYDVYDFYLEALGRCECLSPEEIPTVAGFENAVYFLRVDHVTSRESYVRVREGVGMNHIEHTILEKIKQNGGYIVKKTRRGFHQFLKKDADGFKSTKSKSSATKYNLKELIDIARTNESYIIVCADNLISQNPLNYLVPKLDDGFYGGDVLSWWPCE